MTKYLVLFRGINVGGKNNVPMADLKRLLETHGFTEVVSYLHTGNLIVTSGIGDKVEIRCQIEALVNERFAVATPVLILSEEDLLVAAESVPEWWGKEPETKHNAMFIIPPGKPETMIAEVGLLKEGYEQVAFCEQVIFWSAPLKTFSRTRWAKVHSTTSYQYLTIRNANTFRKLLELMTAK